MKLNSLPQLVGLMMCFIGFSAVALAEEEQAVELKLRYEPGKIYSNKQIITTKMNLGPDMDQVTDMVIKLRSEASKHDEGVAVSIAYEHMKMVSKMGGNTITSYDSSKEDNNEMMKKALDPMMNAKFVAIFDNEGKLIRTEGLGEMLQNPQVGITKDSMEAMIKQSNDMLPKKPIKVGEKWTAKTEFPMAGMGNMSMSFDQTLISVNKQDGKTIAKVDLTGKMKPIEMNQGGMAMKMNAKEIKGVILYDIELKQAVDMTMEMDYEINVAGKEMMMKMKMQYLLTKVEDAE